MSVIHLLKMLISLRSFCLVYLCRTVCYLLRLFIPTRHFINSLLCNSVNSECQFWFFDERVVTVYYLNFLILLPAICFQMIYVILRSLVALFFSVIIPSDLCCAHPLLIT